MQSQEPLVAYRLGAVRSGLRATALVLLLLVLFWVLPGHGHVATGPYLFILVSATAGAIVIWRLPWKRLFEGPLGMRGLYAWSVLDIALITLAVSATGAGGSELFLLYALTTIFFGAAYPRPAQVALLGFTLASYLGMLWAAGWHVGASVVLFRCGVLAIVAMLVSFLSSELLHLLDSLQREGRRAERSAALLSTVADSARMLTLDREQVLDALVESVIGLGFDGAGLCLFDHEAELFAVAYHRGLPAEYVSQPHPAGSGMPGLVRTSGKSEIASAEAKELSADGDDDRLDGFETLIACPVWMDGWLTAALVGASRRTLSPQEIEAFDLLGAQAGLAMENGARFEEMLHTVRRLEELDRLKDDFLATASHELRTPLTVILGSGLTLERRWWDLDDTLRQELIQSLNRNARTLDDLISSLLDFARLGADSDRLNPVPVSLDELLPSVAERLSLLFGQRPLDVEVDRELVVQADPKLLERVMENLLSNAAKHTPPGTRVLLTAHANGTVAEISVSDDGPGVSEEDAEHLGERFFRGGDLNTRAKGIGLGLALVREILELHGSELEIHTELGSGSRFAFRLPLDVDVDASSVLGHLVPIEARETGGPAA